MRFALPEAAVYTDRRTYKAVITPVKLLCFPRMTKDDRTKRCRIRLVQVRWDVDALYRGA